MFCNDNEWKFRSCVILRMWLSLNQTPPIEPIIENRLIIGRLFTFIEQPEDPALQFEALWCVTNLLSAQSDEAIRLIEYGIIPKLGKFSHTQPNKSLNNVIYFFFLNTKKSDSVFFFSVFFFSKFF